MENIRMWLCCSTHLLDLKKIEFKKGSRDRNKK